MYMLSGGERAKPINWNLQVGDWSNLVDRETLVQDMLNLKLLEVIDPHAASSFQQRMFADTPTDFIRARLELHENVRQRIREGALPELAIDTLDLFEDEATEAPTAQEAMDKVLVFVGRFQTARGPRTLGS